MSIPQVTITPTKLPASPIKNILLALGLVLFLALSFKLTNDLTGDNVTVSQTDSVVSSLNVPTAAPEKTSD